MLYWGFHFDNEIPINCLFTQWKWTYILDFGPWRWSALNMGFVVKRPSRMQGQCFFAKLGGVGSSFRSGSKMSREGCPRPDLTPPKVLRGVFNVCPRQPVHWFLGDKGLGIQQGTSVWLGSPKSCINQPSCHRSWPKLRTNPALFHHLR